MKPEKAQELEPKPRPICPGPPKELGTAAKKIWKQLAPKLFGLGLLTEVDLPALTIVCFEGAQISFCYNELKQKELFDGDKKRARIRALLRASTSNYYKFAREFGLTPRGRVGLIVGGDGKGGEGADLLT
jgi:P27 family predicted phage terminase small subunit